MSTPEREFIAKRRHRNSGILHRLRLRKSPQKKSSSALSSQHHHHSHDAQQQQRQQRQHSTIHVTPPPLPTHYKSSSSRSSPESSIFPSDRAIVEEERREVTSYDGSNSTTSSSNASPTCRTSGPLGSSSGSSSSGGGKQRYKQPSNKNNRSSSVSSGNNTTTITTTNNNPAPSPNRSSRNYTALSNFENGGMFKDDGERNPMIVTTDTYATNSPAKKVQKRNMRGSSGAATNNSSGPSFMNKLNRSPLRSMRKLSGNGGGTTSNGSSNTSSSKSKQDRKIKQVQQQQQKQQPSFESSSKSHQPSPKRKSSLPMMPSPSSSPKRNSLHSKTSSSPGHVLRDISFSPRTNSSKSTNISSKMILASPSLVCKKMSSPPIEPSITASTSHPSSHISPHHSSSLSSSQPIHPSPHSPKPTRTASYPSSSLQSPSSSTHHHHHHQEYPQLRKYQQPPDDVRKKSVKSKKKRRKYTSRYGNSSSGSSDKDNISSSRMDCSGDGGENDESNSNPSLSFQSRMGRLERLDSVDSMACQGDMSCTEISLQSKFEEEMVVDEEMDDEVQQKQKQHANERNRRKTGQLLVDQGSKCNESDATDEQFLGSSICTTDAIMVQHSQRQIHLGDGIAMKKMREETSSSSSSPYSDVLAESLQEQPSDESYENESSPSSIPDTVSLSLPMADLELTSPNFSPTTLNVDGSRTNTKAVDSPSPKSLTNLNADIFCPYDDDNFDDVLDDEYDTDEDSDDSSVTVVNDITRRLIQPPPNATQEEKARFYWELCYGDKSSSETNDGNSHTKPLSVTKSWSASRKQPTKSCLSAKKTPWNDIAASASKRMQQEVTPASTQSTKLKQGIESTDDPSAISSSIPTTDGAFMLSTPKTNLPISVSSERIKNVKFGDITAAEFDLTRPSVELTPMPNEIAKERFPIEQVIEESDDESDEMHKETRKNGATLAMWEDDFDSIVDEDDWNRDSNIICDLDENDGGVGKERIRSNISSRRQSMHIKSKGRGDRRSSTFFSKNGGCLLDSDDVIPDSQTEIVVDIESEAPALAFDEVDPHKDEKTSNKEPSLSTSCQDSIQFSSPSTFNSSIRYSSITSSTQQSKDTPKTDVTSSSSLLRSVHTEGGATSGKELMRSHKDGTQDLKPNQLDFTLHKNNDITKQTDVKNQQSQRKRTDFLQIEDLLHNAFTTWKFSDSIRYLYGHRNYFTLHQNMIYKAMNDVVNHPRNHSLLDAFECDRNMSCGNQLLDVLEELDSSTSNLEESGRHQMMKILDMSISFMEQNVPKDNSNHRAVVDSLYQSLSSINMKDNYLIMAQKALNFWQIIEVQSLNNAVPQLLSILDSIAEEEGLIVRRTSKAKICIDRWKENQTRSTKIRLKQIQLRKRRQERREKMNNINKRIEEEIHAMGLIEKKTRDEEANLQRKNIEEDLWRAKGEFEQHIPFDMIDWRVLSMVAPFQARNFFHNEIAVSFSHMDGSETLFTWRSRSDEKVTTNKGRDSIDSVLSGDTAIITRPPEIIRRLHVVDDKERNGKSNYRDDYLSNGSVAQKMYSAILDSNSMQSFISSRFRQEQDITLFTISDVFTRLDLMAKDVLALQKYYNCRVEVPRKTNSILLHVTISMGQVSSIGVRYTYDLSDPRTLLHSIPSEVYVMSITGEPAVPINILLRVAKKSLTTLPICNAYILKRTCSAIIDTLQGR